MRAASRASPTSKNSRAPWKWRWPSSVDSICRTAGAMPEKMWLAVGISTRGARAVGELDQAGLLQRDQRLANRRAADAEARLQVALGRQLVAGLQLAGEDLRLEMRGDMLEELLALDDERVDHRPFIPSYLTTMQQLARMTQNISAKARPCGGRLRVARTRLARRRGRGSHACASMRRFGAAGSECMRIAILGGGGAMGGLFGGYLARAGNDVTLIDVSQPAVDAINGDGLTIEEKDGSQPVIRVPASDRSGHGRPGRPDHQFRQMLPHRGGRARGRADDRQATPRCSACRTAGATRRASPRIVGEDKVLVGLTYHGGTLLGAGPGQASRHRHDLCRRAHRQADRPAGARWSRRSAPPAIETTQSDRILDEVWKKLALNACTLPTSALLGFFAHELVAFDGTKSLMAAILKEVVAVAKAQGIALDYDERWAAITGLLEKAIGGKASMLQDVEAKRQTEIEVINGAIVDGGQAHRRADAAQRDHGLDDAGRRAALPPGEGASAMSGRLHDKAAI